jgi:hypothetical protein
LNKGAKKFGKSFFIFIDKGLVGLLVRDQVENSVRHECCSVVHSFFLAVSAYVLLLDFGGIFADVLSHLLDTRVVDTLAACLDFLNAIGKNGF